MLQATLQAEGEGGVGRLAADDAAGASLAEEDLAGKMLAAMLVARPFGQIAGAGGFSRLDEMGAPGTAAPGSEQDALAQYVTQYFHGMVDVLDTLPRPLLLLLKANDCLRTMARQLEAPVSVPLAVTCLSCLRGLRASASRGWSLRERWSWWLAYLKCRLFLIITMIIMIIMIVSIAIIVIQ